MQNDVVKDIQAFHEFPAGSILCVEGFPDRSRTVRLGERKVSLLTEHGISFDRRFLVPLF
jgi:hypothetical protein